MSVPPPQGPPGAIAYWELSDDGHTFAEMERAHVAKLQGLHPAPEGLAGLA